MYLLLQFFILIYTLNPIPPHQNTLERYQNITCENLKQKKN